MFINNFLYPIITISTILITIHPLLRNNNNMTIKLNKKQNKTKKNFKIDHDV